MELFNILFRCFFFGVLAFAAAFIVNAPDWAVFVFYFVISTGFDVHRLRMKVDDEYAGRSAR